MVNNVLGTYEEGCGEIGREYFTQMHLVTRFVFAYSFKPPATKIYIIFVRFVFVVVGCHDIPKEFNLVYPESGYGLLPCFYSFPDIIYNRCQATVFKLVCPAKVVLKGCSANR